MKATYHLHIWKLMDTYSPFPSFVSSCLLLLGRMEPLHADKYHNKQVWLNAMYYRTLGISVSEASKASQEVDGTWVG